MTLNVWDRAGGGDTYGAVLKAFYKKVTAAVIVFDINERSTFDSIGTYAQDLEKFVPGGCPVLVIANKMDLLGPVRQVDPDAVKELCRQLKRSLNHDIEYAETSAADASSVSAAFSRVARLIVDCCANMSSVGSTGTQSSDVSSGDDIDCRTAACDSGIIRHGRLDDGSDKSQQVLQEVPQEVPQQQSTLAVGLPIERQHDSPIEEPNGKIVEHVEGKHKLRHDGEDQTSMEQAQQMKDGSAGDICERLFDAVDKDRSGWLDETEAKFYLQCVGCDVADLDFYWRDLLRAADTDRDGKISKAEFLEYVLGDEELDAEGCFEDKEQEQCLLELLRQIDDGEGITDQGVKTELVKYSTPKQLPTFQNECDDEECYDEPLLAGQLQKSGLSTIGFVEMPPLLGSGNDSQLGRPSPPPIRVDSSAENTHAVLIDSQGELVALREATASKAINAIVEALLIEQVNKVEEQNWKTMDRNLTAELEDLRVATATGFVDIVVDEIMKSTHRHEESVAVYEAHIGALDDHISEQNLNLESMRAQLEYEHLLHAQILEEMRSIDDMTAMKFESQETIITDQRDSLEAMHDQLDKLTKLHEKTLQDQDRKKDLAAQALTSLQEKAIEEQRQIAITRSQLEAERASIVAMREKTLAEQHLTKVMRVQLEHDRKQHELAQHEFSGARKTSAQELLALQEKTAAGQRELAAMRVELATEHKRHSDLQVQAVAEQREIASMRVQLEHEQELHEKERQNFAASQEKASQELADLEAKLAADQQELSTMRAQ
eukprot:SAG31_NODE_4422_length_3248_cov_5.342966_2_plen_774_part_01